MVAFGVGAKSFAANPSRRIVIPLIAVLANNAGHSTVWVVDKKTMSVHRRDVKTGDLSGADNIRISSGLKDGEVIAISGVSKLQEGQIVRKLD
jgi:multidrug efflux pump subunit AcrA (membrane-fusion protein)